MNIDGKNLSEWSKEEPLALRRFGQLVFQSPRRSFDPRMRLGRALSEPIRALEKRTPNSDELALWMSRVGLSPELLDRYPHQLSGVNYSESVLLEQCRSDLKSSTLMSQLAAWMSRCRPRCSIF